MMEFKAKQNSIFEKSISIAVYLTFWIIAKFVIPIISLGLRLYSKESQIKNDLSQGNLQASQN